MTLLALHLDLDGDGIRIEEIKDFDVWCSERKNFKFIDRIPNEWHNNCNSPEERADGESITHYVLLKAEIVVPKPVQVVEKYSL